ncbi:MAG: SDR family oxidoreductase [Clostridia bacterium]
MEKLVKLLVTGNLGYVGTVLTAHLDGHPGISDIIGYDNGYFRNNAPGPVHVSPNLTQVTGDVRSFDADLLKGVDCVISLAAVSNDPAGERFRLATEDINFRATMDLARRAKEQNVARFIFASSCSVYGDSGQTVVDETSPVHPLTTYAQSKLDCETALEELSNENFSVVCLRFATACGVSPRFRLDLVLNDFVYHACRFGRIDILSDGTPLRPFIHVRDMATAFEWAVFKDPAPYTLVNAGSNELNLSVRDLAEEVAKRTGDVLVTLNSKAVHDSRSYRVDFSRYAAMAGTYAPRHDIGAIVRELAGFVRHASFGKEGFHRLMHLEKLVKEGFLNEKLEWIRHD